MNDHGEYYFKGVFYLVTSKESTPPSRVVYKKEPQNKKTSMPFLSHVHLERAH